MTSINLDHEGQKRDLIHNFPQEIAADIASRLPIKSLIRFRLVSKTWKSLSQQPLFINLCHSRALSRDPFLILQSFCTHFESTELYFAEFDYENNQHIIKCKKFHQIPFSSSSFYVIGSCNGMLCLLMKNSSSSDHDQLWLYNPFTRDYKKIPELLIKNKYYYYSKTKNIYDQCMFGFGFHSSNAKDEFKIVKICYPSSYLWSLLRFTSNIDKILTRTEVLVLTIDSSGKAEKWRNIGEVPQDFKLEKKRGVFVNGRIHWFCEWCYKTNDRKIISFDLFDEQFKEIPKPNFHESWYNCQLVQIQGCLATAIFIPSNRESFSFDVWIMEKYGIQESWIKKFKIRDYLKQIMGDDLRISMKFFKEFSGGFLVKVVCVFKNGEILMEFRGETLVCYNPESGLCLNLGRKSHDEISLLPHSLFQTIAHVGSLNWIH